MPKGKHVKLHSNIVYKTRVKSYMEEIAFNKPSDRISRESVNAMEEIIKRITKNIIKTTEILTRKSGRCTCLRKDVEDAIEILDLSRFN